jgi:mRNA interferase MazF
MNCGDIYLVSFPFTDNSTAKVRPVLIVSSDSFHAGEDVIVVPISSKSGPNDRLCLRIDQKDREFQDTGLRVASIVKWTKPFTISKRVVLRRLGALRGDRLREVRERIQSLFRD